MAKASRGCLARIACRLYCVPVRPLNPGRRRITAVLRCLGAIALRIEVTSVVA